MADFSMSLKGLSVEAQRFMFERDIENGDGKMTTSERDKLAKLLSGGEPFPSGYNSVKDELIEFGRKFDVAALKNALSKERRADIESKMSEKDKKQIDTINDYNALKDIAEGKGDYTDLQREYARALLEDSSYARELRAQEENSALATENSALKEENGILKEKNQELMTENSELRAYIDSIRPKLDEAYKKKATIQMVTKDLDSLPNIDKSTISDCVSKIDSNNNDIIKNYEILDKSVKSFEQGNLSEELLKNTIKQVNKNIEESEKNIQIEKDKGRKILDNSKGKDGVDSNNNPMGQALMSLFGVVLKAAGAVGGKVVNQE